MHVQAAEWKNTHQSYLSLLSSASRSPFSPKFSVIQRPAAAKITELQDWLAFAATSDAEFCIAGQIMAGQ